MHALDNLLGEKKFEGKVKIQETRGMKRSNNNKLVGYL